MAAERVTPVDPETGLPLSIIPGCYEIPINSPEEADPHHVYHPWPSFKGSLALAALRNCRVHIVETSRHNQTPEAYHRRWAGPLVPETEEEVFGLVIVACAGAKTWYGIDTQQGDQVERRMTQAEYDTMWTPSPDDPFGYRYVFYNYEPVKNFLVDYLLRQKLGHEEKIVDRFLHASKPEAKQFWGHVLLAKAAEVATDTRRDQYAKLRREGVLHPAMPPAPQTLAKHKLGTPEKRVLLLPKLEESLRVQFNYPAEIQAA